MKRVLFSAAAASAMALAMMSMCAYGAQDAQPAGKLDEILQDGLARDHLAGLTVVVRKDGVGFYSKSGGFADLEQNVRATPAGVYAIGSITKSMTAYCILTLINEGKLAMTSRLRDVLPDYRGPGGEVTIHQLLTHTSGIPDYAGDSAPDLIGDPSRRSYSEQDVLAMFSSHPAVFPPGTRWQYSNSGFYLLGLVIEKLTGRPYDEVVHDRLLTPFGLTSVAMDYRTPLMKGRVRGYAHDEAGNFQNGVSYDASIAWAAGGYRATAGDLARYIELLFSDKTPLTVRNLMTAPTALGDGTAINYRASALFESRLQGHQMFSHGGAIWGFSALVAYMPADKLAIAILTNTEDAGVGLGALTRRIARTVLNIPPPTVQDLTVPDKEARRYAGAYCLHELMESGDQVDVSYDGHSLKLSRPILWSSERVVSRLRSQGHGRFVPEDDDDLSVVFAGDGRRGMDIALEQAAGITLSGSQCRGK